LTEFWVVLQEGWSPCECYAEVYETEKEGRDAVESHKEATYHAVNVRVAMRSAVSLEQAVDMADAMAGAALAFADLQDSVRWGLTKTSPK
jgi:hypothetical protein